MVRLIREAGDHQVRSASLAGLGRPKPAGLGRVRAVIEHLGHALLVKPQQGAGGAISLHTGDVKSEVVKFTEGGDGRERRPIG